MSSSRMQTIQLGQSIPPDTAHASYISKGLKARDHSADLEQAVSVSLPTWKACIGYEKGEEWVVSKIRQAYPRFFIHESITRFSRSIIRRYGSPTQEAMLFPSHSVAERCVDFLMKQSEPFKVGNGVQTINLKLVTDAVDTTGRSGLTPINPVISAVLYPCHVSKTMKAFWQHTGDGISSRRAEFCHRAFEEGHLRDVSHTEHVSLNESVMTKGPRRYQRGASQDTTNALSTKNANVQPRSPASIARERKDYTQFVEERFGRNLDLSLVSNAKLAIRRRIAGSLSANIELEDAIKHTQKSSRMRQLNDVSEDDVYLYPAGMSSIFNTHRTMLAARGTLKSICFGFPYIDTLKVLQKWGPDCLFYGMGSSEDLDNLETRCVGGEKFLALFCEFPGNPLLKSPDLQRIKRLGDQYDFAVVVDETIGNFTNVHVLAYADVAVSSLTKVFSGDSNVMGGSAVLNRKAKYYELLKQVLSSEYEDNYWAEDAVFMERNSRDYVARIERINHNAEVICCVLEASSHVKEIYYPKYSPTRHFYDSCRNANGGYGGLLSVTFNSTSEAMTFYDMIEVAKGPSLGTNFTLCSPYTLLAHYGELDWAAKFGVEQGLVRFSVGLEDPAVLVSIFRRALEHIEKSRIES